MNEAKRPPPSSAPARTAGVDPHPACAPLITSGERELSTLKSRHDLIIDAISEGLIVIDGDSRILEMNRSARTMFRCGEDTLGLHADQFFGYCLIPGDGRGRPRELTGLRADGSPIRIEVTVLSADVEQRTLYVATVRDMTERMFNRKRLREKAFLLEKTKTFIVTIVHGKGIEWCNPCFEQATGYSLSQLAGRSPSEFLIDERCPGDVIDELTAAVNARQPFSGEIMMRHASGRPFWAHVDAHPMSDPDTGDEKYVALGLDITERKRQDQMHVDFVSMVSHELRTPLTVISGAFDALEAGIGGELPELAHELVTMGQRNCVQLSTLISDLLDVNKMEAGVLSLQSEEVDLRALVQDVVTSLAPTIEAAGLTISLDSKAPGARVFADPQRLRQVLLNLLSNAKKFSRAHGHIAVGIASTGAKVRISVADQGCGIPAEFRPRLFEKFSRDTGVQASGKEGFGLGLFISKGLIERLGGHIGFQTVEGEGSTFTVELPRVDRPAVRRPKAAAPAHAV